MAKQSVLSSIVLIGVIALFASISNIADYRRISQSIVSQPESESGATTALGTDVNNGSSSNQHEGEEARYHVNDNETQRLGESDIFDGEVGERELDGGINVTLSESKTESTRERKGNQTESRSAERLPSPVLSLKRSTTNQSSSSTTQGNSTRMPRFLWGIITMDSPKEKKRQKALRETYLSYFKTIRSNSTRQFICSVDELIHKKVKQNDCFIIYAFVVGANPSGPTHLMATNDTESMTVDSSTISDPVNDMIYLNIQENMNDGKSESWFKYALRLLDQGIDFDYIVKTDSDTLVFPDRFYDWVKDESLPSSPHNRFVYGGYPYYAGIMCCNLDKPMIGPLFMGGELYFMSPDLARFITSPSLDRESVWVDGHEDMSIGNYVYSYNGEIRVTKIGEPGSKSPASHPMKDVGRLRRNYAKRRGWRRTR